MAETHLQSFTSKRTVSYNILPTDPLSGDFFFDNLNNRMMVFLGNQWVYAPFTTTTSTSTSTTTTSTSTTTTSTSSSTSSSTTTSSSTSTTTTL